MLASEGTDGVPPLTDRHHHRVTGRAAQRHLNWNRASYRRTRRHLHINLPQPNEPGREAAEGSRLLNSSETDRRGTRRGWEGTDRKSTRLNSSHLGISYAV